MSTTAIRGLRVALESSFGSPDANGFPSASGLTFYGVECERGNATIFGDPQLTERVEARASFHNLPPEPLAAQASSVYVRRRKGEITIKVPARGLGSGTAFATYAAIPYMMLLRSSLSSQVPSDASDALNSTGTANSHTVTTAAEFITGGGFKTDVAGRPVYRFTTRKVGSVIDYSPGISPLAGGTTQRHLQVMYFAPGASIGGSVALELDGYDSLSYAYGCRMKSLRLVLDDKRASWEITMACAYVTDGHTSGNNVAEPTRASGAVAQLRNSWVEITEAIGTTTPAALTGVQVPVDDVRFSLDVTLTEVGTTSNAIGISDMEPTDWQASLGLTLSSVVSTYVDDLYNMTQRSVLVGFGPQGTGNGMCIYMPAATLQNDPSAFDQSGDTLKMQLEYKQGLWTLDSSSTAPAQTPLRLGFSL